MSTSAFSLPSDYKEKSLWQRPEGNAAKLLAVLIAAGLGFAAYVFILPFLLSVVWGTIQLVIGVAVLGVVGWAVFNPTIRNIVKDIFQSLARAAAWTYTTVNPIGILQNNLDNMKKTFAQLRDNIGRFAGSQNKLRVKIQADEDDFVKFMNIKKECETKASQEQDPIKRQGYILKANGNTQKANVLQVAIKQLKGLDKQTDDMLKAFRRWGQVVEVQIDTTSYQVDFLKDQREMVLQTQANLSLGKRLLHGDPEELKLVNMSIEYLADEAARTMGEVAEFNRTSEDLFDNMDLESSVNTDALKKKFDELTSKLPENLQLTSGTTSSLPNSVEAVGNEQYQAMFRK
jgi:phage shock protein A